MPFNGSGTFVRTQNWTNDANNNLPISATKFDNEDNDFAGGLSLCLTRDGQGVPSVPLTWTQPLTINVAADGADLKVGRTGGANNPQLQLTLADATGATINLSTAQTLGLAIAGTSYLSIAGTGAISAKAPSGNAALAITTAAYTFGNATDNPTYTFAGTGAVALNGPVSLAATPGQITLTINGAASQFAEKVLGSSTNGQSFGTEIFAGTTAADIGLYVANQANSSIFLSLAGDGHGQIGPTSWTAGGAVTIATPTSGIALSVNQLSGQQCAEFKGTAPSVLVLDGGANGAYLQLASSNAAGYTINASYSVGSAGPLNIQTGSVTRLALQATAPTLQGWGPLAGALIDLTPDTALFTGTLTGFTSNPTGSCAWNRVGNLLFLTIPALTGTSNSTAMTLTGGTFPTPVRTVGGLVWTENNGGQIIGQYQLSAGSTTVTFLSGGSAAGWVGSNPKGIPIATTITIQLD